jgi:hypothetical protein
MHRERAAIPGRHAENATSQRNRATQVVALVAARPVLEGFNRMLPAPSRSRAENQGFYQITLKCTTGFHDLQQYGSKNA